MERFISLYGDFLKDLKVGFPSFKIPSECGDCVNFFIKNNFPYMIHISLRNEDYFKLSQDAANCMLVDGIKFRDIIKCASKSDMAVIWKYLQSLYVLCIGNEDIRKIIESVNDEKHKEILESKDVIRNNIVESNKVESDESKSENTQQQEKPDIFDGTVIGSLAKELAKDIDVSSLNLNGLDNLSGKSPIDLFKSLFGGGEGANDGISAIGKMMQTVIQKMDTKIKSGELDVGTLRTEAFGLMGSLYMGQNGSSSSNHSSSNHGSSHGNKQTIIKKKKGKKVVKKQTQPKEQNKSNDNAKDDVADVVLEDTLNEMSNNAEDK